MMALSFQSLINDFFTKDERNTILFLTIVFLAGLSVSYLRNDNTNMELILTGHNEEIENIISSNQVISVNLNLAKAEDLISLPRIGPVTAEKIIALRLKMGSFTSIEDLFEVSGIGVKTVEKILEFIEI